MQLVLVTHRRRTALKVTDITAFVGDDQGPLKLSGIERIDSKVGRQLHWATHPLGNIHKRAFGKHRRIQCCIKVVSGRHHGSQILTHEFGMIGHGFRQRAEDHSRLRQFVLEGRRDRYAIKHRIHRHPRKRFLLFQGDAELVVSLDQFGVNFVQAFRPVLVALGRRVVADRLKIDRVMVDVRPFGLVHFLPTAEGLQPPLQDEVGF